MKIHQGSQPGFTLVEFIVIISIFAIMASVALFNFAGFRSNVAQNNLAHDIALTIRQAQVFGWSTVSDVDQNAAVQFDSSENPVRRMQGISFPYDGGSYSTSFYLYRKSDGAVGAYTPATDFLVDTIRIQGTSRISDIRTASARDDLLIDPATQQVVSGSSQSVGQEVSIAFSRPRPEAVVFAGFNQLIGQTADYVGIYISSIDDPAGTVRKVIIISRLGEIEVI